MLESATGFLTTLGLCAGVALEFRPPVTAARLFAKDKYLEPMFGDVGQARTNAAMLLLMIEYNLKPHLHKTHCCAFGISILSSGKSRQLLH